MDRAPVMDRGLRAGAPTRMEEEDSLADALVGGIGLENRYTFRTVQEFVDDFVLVSQKQIAEAMAFALEKQRLIAEGSASVGIAALLSGGLEAAAQNVAVVVNGSNVDLPLLLQVAQNDIGASDLAS